MTGRRGRRLKQLLGDLKEKRGYWKLTVEVLASILWKKYSLWKRLWACRKTDKRMNELRKEYGTLEENETGLRSYPVAGCFIGCAKIYGYIGIIFEHTIFHVSVKFPCYRFIDKNFRYKKAVKSRSWSKQEMSSQNWHVYPSHYRIFNVLSCVILIRS